ncbi:Nn.00g041550.m01.CDS01 [Neocucurbitaria sp. VM-36]
MVNTYRGQGGRGGRGGFGGQGGAGGGRGDTRGDGAGRGGAGMPAGVPSAPASMRQGGQQTRGGIGRGGRGGAAPGANAGPAPTTTTTTTTQRTPLDPQRFRPPPGHFDQAYLGHIGSFKKWTLCLRCRQPKDVLHPLFAKCVEKCGFCETYDHPGEPCPKIYASSKWWGEHHGNFPDHCRQRPTEAQREELAELDEWFRHNPRPVQELQQQQQAQGPTKRKAEDDLQGELDRAKLRVVEETLKGKLMAAKRQIIDAQQEALAAKGQSMDLEQQVRKLARSAEGYDAQLEKARAEAQKAEVEKQAVVQEFSLVKDALVRQEQAKFARLAAQMQKQFEAQLQHQVLLERRLTTERLYAGWIGRLDELRNATTAEHENLLGEQADAALLETNQSEQASGLPPPSVGASGDVTIKEEGGTKRAWSRLSEQEALIPHGEN